MEPERWFGDVHHHDDLARQRALVAAALYGSAAALVGGSVLLTWSQHEHPAVVAAIAGLGAILAAGFVIVARTHAIPLSVHVVTTALGSVLVGALVAAGGATFAGAYAVLLGYVVAFSLYYFPLPLALGQVALAACTYAVALALVAGHVPRLAYWLLFVGACGLGAGLVGWLGRHTRRLLQRERQAAARFAVLDRSKDRFLNLVAHDLRGPLAGIIGSAEVIAAHFDTLPPEAIQDLANRQAQHGRRLVQIVEDLLDLERLRLRALHPQHKPVRLDELAVRLLHEFDLSDRPTTIDTPPVTVTGDPVLLERAVDNLVGNAVKHTPAGSPLEIATRRQGGRVELSVADRGPGVADSERESIFEPFTAGPRSSSAGMGLALVREIAQAHNGMVRVDPRCGGGARFTLCLPAGPAAGDATAAARSA